MNEEYVTMIIGDTEAIMTLVDDMVRNVSLEDQHRLHAIYILLEHLLKRATALDKELVAK